MIPTVDDIQHVINQLINLVMEVSKGISWQREYTHDENKGMSLTMFLKKLKDKLTGITFLVLSMNN